MIANIKAKFKRFFLKNINLNINQPAFKNGLNVLIKATFEFRVTKRYNDQLTVLRSEMYATFTIIPIFLNNVGARTSNNVHKSAIEIYLY